MNLESKIRLAWDGKKLKVEIVLSRKVAVTLIGIALWLYSPDLLSKIQQVLETLNK
jgi:hypothetical protein